MTDSWIGAENDPPSKLHFVPAWREGIHSRWRVMREQSNMERERERVIWRVRERERERESNMESERENKRDENEERMWKWNRS